MTLALLSTEHPRLLVTREIDGDERWYETRRGGITGTEIRDWGEPAKRRAILKEKVTGERDDRRVRAFEHGKYREPFLAQWAEMTHGVVHTSGVFAHPRNDRFMCTPDGYLGGFSLAYEPGLKGVTVEVKTTTKDLTPGILGEGRVLVEVDRRSHFHKTKYMRQIQWQMFVMNAASCLFIWEPYTTEQRDPETGHYVVTGPPEWCIIPRDRLIIEGLIREAEEALATIDEARRAHIGGLPPVSDVPVTEAMLLNDLFTARESAALAEAARVKAWDALTAHYDKMFPLDEKAEFAEPRGFANVSRSIPRSRPTRKFDAEAAKRKAPKRFAELEAFMERYTVEEPGKPGAPRYTITDQRGKD